VLARALPGPGPGSDVLAAVLGALAVAAVALALVPARDDPVGLTVFAAGGVLLAGALATADTGGLGTTVETAFAAAAGLLFAYAFDVPAALVAVPLLVGGIDLAAALTSDRTFAVPADDVDVLTLALPQWGGPRAGEVPYVASLGLLDATFLAMFAGWSARYGLRPRTVAVLLAAALAGSVAWAVAAERTVPALPMLALAFLVPAAPGLRRMLSRP